MFMLTVLTSFETENSSATDWSHYFLLLCTSLYIPEDLKHYLLQLLCSLVQKAAIHAFIYSLTVIWFLVQSPLWAVIASFKTCFIDEPKQLLGPPSHAIDSRLVRGQSTWYQRLSTTFAIPSRFSKRVTHNSTLLDKDWDKLHKTMHFSQICMIPNAYHRTVGLMISLAILLTDQSHALLLKGQPKIFFANSRFSHMHSPL